MQPAHQSQQILTLMQQRGGYLTSQEVAEAKLPKVALTRLLRSHQIERVERGVYRLPDTGSTPLIAAERQDLLAVQLRYPAALPCLISALHLHGLTTTRPARLQFAVQNNRTPLQSEHLPVETFYFSAKYYQTGQQHLDVGTRTLLTYTPEKTLLDLLRYAPKFGRELYLEGLKKYLKNHRSPYALMQLAGQLGSDKELLRDLEVLSHDQDH
ncbi:hypothetical protein Dxin01_04211 [Deinococcus xinjiangensis]|uniref:Transcriptional regulator n=1 Tax=Deinococcus xinjiangensis TaxID=457454 RepID=A0ABP9VIF9_9DEIO